jgi:hypothetical protein
MELLAIIFLWPFIILAAGLVFVVFYDVVDSSGAIFWWLPFLMFFALLIMKKSFTEKKTKEMNQDEQVNLLRKMLAVFSISLLFPIFIRYMLSAFNEVLPAFIIGLIIGFGFLVWGIFVKNHKTIMYSNIIGGALTLLYLYSRLWDLGEGARVAAAAFGLVVAVTIAFIKLKDKLS